MLGEPNALSIACVGERRCRACDRSVHPPIRETPLWPLCANTLEADDLYQDTWLQVVKNFSRYDTSQGFEPWLTKICVNLYRNALRRLSKSPFLHFRSNEEKEFLLCSIPAPEKVDYRPIYEAIDHLPEKYRLAVILYYFDDRDIAATAQILGIPSGIVKSRLDKARKLLKEALGNETDL